VVDYEPLPAVATIDQALDPQSTPVWDAAEGNVLWSDSRTFGGISKQSSPPAGN